MNIDLLPDEVICQIFSNIPLSLRLIKLSLVCKRWRYICEEFVPWNYVKIGRGNILSCQDLFRIARHSRHIKTCFLNNSLEIYRPLDSFTYIMEKYFRAPKLREIDMSYCNIKSLEFVQWSPILNTLTLRYCNALSMHSLLSLGIKYVTVNLEVLDISYCIDLIEEDMVIEQIVKILPHLLELYAFGFPISVHAVSRILDTFAFDKLQVLGATCEPGHRPWQYESYIVGRYPDFHLLMNEFEDDISSVISYPSGSD